MTDCTMNTTEAHARLDAFVGTFRAEITIHMGPESLTSTGTMVIEWDLDGKFLKQTYTGDPNDGPFANFEGRGFWGFNTVTNMYEGFWIDTAGTMMQHETGDVDDSGKVWTMKGRLQSPKGEMVKRSVITLVDDDHHTMDMYFVVDGNENKGMEIKYTRA